MRAWGRVPGGAARIPRPSVHSADIDDPVISAPTAFVGILRFLVGVRRRCGTDVSTIDTAGPPGVPGGGVVGRLPREPNPVQVVPGRSPLWISDVSSADRGPRFPTGTSLTSTGRRLRPSLRRTTQSSAGRYVVDQGPTGRPGASGCRCGRPGNSR